MTSSEFGAHIETNDAALTSLLNNSGDLPGTSEHGDGSPKPIQTLSLDDVQGVLDQLAALPDDDEDEEDEEVYDDYPRKVMIRFPDECREMFGYVEMEFPIREILNRAIEGDPENSELFQKIRNEFYSGDKDEDFEWGLAYADNWAWSPKRSAEIRLARSRFDVIREENRESHETDSEHTVVHPHYLSMEHPFGKEQEAFQIQEDRNRRDRVALDSDWGTLVHMALEAKRKGGSDADFEPVIEFENCLNTREEVFNEDWKALNKQRSALVDRIRNWYWNQQKQA